MPIATAEHLRLVIPPGVETQHPAFAQSQKEIAHNSIELAGPNLSTFKDGTPNVQISNVPEGSRVIISSLITGPDALDNLIETTQISAAIGHDTPDDASSPRATGGIHIVAPAIEGRGDRRTRDKDGIYIEAAETQFAYFIANMLSDVGHVDTISVLDPHSWKFKKEFEKRGAQHVIALSALPTAATYMLEHGLIENKTGNWVIELPDGGSIGRGLFLADATGLEIGGRADKSRKAGEAKIEAFHGNIQRKKALVGDDMISSGGTLEEAVEEALHQGAEEVGAVVTHVIGIEGADEKVHTLIQSGKLKFLVVSNSTPYAKQLADVPGVHVVDIHPLLAEYSHAALTGQARIDLTPHIFPLRSYEANLRHLFERYPHLAPDHRPRIEDAATNGYHTHEIAGMNRKGGVLFVPERNGQRSLRHVIPEIGVPY